MSETTKLHNESMAEFNGSGPTVDAAVSLPKPSLDRTHIAAYILAGAVGAVAVKVLPKILFKAAETVETVAEVVE